jgi:hypothetical protein
MSPWLPGSVALLLCSALASFSATALVPRGADWRYLTTGAAPAEWRQTEFIDADWYSGQAELGYGEGDEETALFLNPEDAPITSYFRHAFVVTNRAMLHSATLRVVGDDAFVAYLNGVEVGRRNLPAGPITPGTVAIQNIEQDETNYVQFGISTGSFRPGTNVLAIELHQHLFGQDDASFDAELLVNVPLGRPVVTITNPPDLSVIASGPIVIESRATDQEGHVVRVEYFTNGAAFATTFTEPYRVVWSNAPPGRYSITARAYDHLQLHGVSVPVHVQVGDVTSAPRVVRGPYLQSGSSTSIVVRWRLDWPADALLRFGTDIGNLTNGVAIATNMIDHAVTVTDLQPATRYFYTVGSASDVMGGGQDFYFDTSPTNARPVRIWIIGDSGTANEHAAGVYAAYRNLTGAQRTDVWLMLGDNAYGEGSDSEYQAAVFNMYPELLRTTAVWPALGNHDAGDSPDGDSNPFQNIFTLPKEGVAGGVPSGSELYYSFDHANVHFVCLDSFVSDRSTNGPMLAWLKEDLAATDKDWIIAYWHHPPYSWGGHSSDVEFFGIEMRERVNPILEEYGVDLVFAGHSHEYERSLLIQGHYGYSWELEPHMIVNGGSGFAPDSPYQKPAGGMGSRCGTVYTVCGCSGEGGSQNVEKHPAMARSLGGYGSVVLQVDGLQLSAGFLRPTGEYEDQFQIDKSAPSSIRPEMDIVRTQTGALISWPTSLPEYSLFRSPAIPGSNGEPVMVVPTRNGRRNLVPVPTSSSNGFFHLKSDP